MDDEIIEIGTPEKDALELDFSATYRAFILVLMGAMLTVGFTSSNYLIFALGVFWGIYCLFYLPNKPTNLPSKDFMKTLYLTALKRLLDKVTVWIGDKGNIDKLHVSRFTIPLTIGSFEKVLLLALIYPILFVFLFWVIGGSGAIGDLILFPDIDDLDRFLVASVVVVLFYLVYKVSSRRNAAWIAMAFFGSVAGILVGADTFADAFVSGFDLTGAFVLAFAVAGAVANSSAIVLAFTFAGAAAFTGAFAFVFVFAITIITAFALIMTRIYFRFYNKGEMYKFWLTAITLYLSFPLILIPTWDYFSIELGDLSILIFLVVLPLLNCPFDWLSLGITRKLLYQIQKGKNTGGKAFFWSLLDLVLALIFMFLITTVVVVYLSVGNLLSGGRFFDTQLILDNMSNVGDIDNYWVYLLFLSTLIPTIFHFVIASLALGTWIPQPLLPHIKSKKVGLLYLSLGQPLGFLIGPALLWAVIYYSYNYFGASFRVGALWWIQLLIDIIQ